MKKAFTLAEGATHVAIFSGHRNFAFTLAEVLITLGIIGVVAALTLPALINQIDNKQNIVAMKKAYSELSQVRALLDADAGESFTSLCNTFDDICLRDLFAQKIKVLEKCNSNAPNKCQELSSFPGGSTIKNQININYGWPMIITGSGYSVKFRFHISDCDSYSEKWHNGKKELNSCGWMQVDTNGKRAPNIAGKDIFFIFIYKDKLVPLDYTVNNCNQVAGVNNCPVLSDIFK